MAAIDAIGVGARQVLLDVMMAVAWADREVAPDERKAAEAAAMSLGLVLPADHDHGTFGAGPLRLEDLSFEALSPRERELVYVCAAWMALADAVEQDAEVQLLRALGARLGLEGERADWLHARAAELRQAQAAAPSTWWRAFDRLVVEAARALHTDAR